MPRLHRVARPALAALLLCLAGQARGAEAGDRVVKGSAAVAFSLVRAAADEGRPLREGDFVEVRFRIDDAASGQPLTGLKPAAWMDVGDRLQDQRGGQRECKDKIGLYLKGIVGIRPLVDLNSAFLLVLNRDPSISVIDPVVSMSGRTSLYATVVLKRPPADWVRSTDSRRFYVSMPQAGEVAVVDAEGFKVAGTVAAGPNPVRVALQQDRRLLWVGNDAREAGESGVTVVDVEALRPLASIPTGPGHHELAFSPDGKRAFVSNRDGGTVSVVDVARLAKVSDLRTGGVPISLAVSPLSGALYVADGRSGDVTAWDPATLKPLARVATRPGLGPLRTSPDGRWIFGVNPAENAAVVVDATRNALVHTIPAGGKPYQVVFTRAFAYLRLLDSPRVVMVNLASLGEGRAPIVQGFEAGTGAPSQAGDLSIADAIAPASFDASIYLVNPADGFVYFYMEGMNAPMGSYGAYGHAARAVAVADRSLQEVAPGVYGGKLRIPAAGRYDVAFLLDAPRVLHCFSVEAAPNPELRQDLGALAVDFGATPARAAAGAPVELQFRLLDPVTREPRAGLEGVRLTAFLAPGQHRTELPVREVAPGTFQATLTPPKAGAWYVHVSVPPLGVKPTDLPFHTIIVDAPPAKAPAR